MGSLRTKAPKKQPAFASSLKDTSQTRSLEKAILELEDAVFHVLDTDKTTGFQDVDFLYWNRKLKNIATLLSLALSEHRGPRRFHYHFRHLSKNYETLVPVAGPSPLVTLARVCRESLTYCSEMVGVQDKTVLSNRELLEGAIRAFLKVNNSSQ